MPAQFGQEDHLATIVGNWPAGGLLSQSRVEIGHEYTLVLFVATYTSRSGITPDIPVDWSYEAALDG